MGARVSFCDEVTEVEPDAGLTIGREADLVIDVNPYLHRLFLHLGYAPPLWRLRNMGSALVATVIDQTGGLVARLGPATSIPLPRSTRVRFVAGATKYELEIDIDDAEVWEPPPADTEGMVTLVGVRLSRAQHRLLLALVEPSLRSPETGASRVVPTYLELAQRLGEHSPPTDRHRWTEKSCERMLGEVFRKLDHARVRFSGDQKRAALSDYVISTGIVKPAELGLLDWPEQDSPPGQTGPGVPADG
jgi:hypothetical protein